jgi:hypothetical protein
MVTISILLVVYSDYTILYYTQLVNQDMRAAILAIASEVSPLPESHALRRKWFAADGSRYEYTTVLL